MAQQTDANKLPALPGAGRTFTDPDFGTKIVQLTDEHDGASCNNAYSYWPSFNADSSRLHVYCRKKGALLYSFDPQKLAVENKEPLFASKTPHGTSATWLDAIWSLHPDILFARDETSLWRYNVKKKRYAHIFNFAKVLPAGHTLYQMSKNKADNRFAFTEMYKHKRVGYIVYDDTAKKIIYRATRFPYPLDEVQLDKTGRYLVVKLAVPPPVKAAAVSDLVVDLSTRKVTSLVNGKPHFAPGHSDNGTGVVVGYDRWNNTITRRSLAAPAKPKNIFSFEDDWTGMFQFSMLSDDERWVIVTANNGSGGGKYHNEILAIETSGTGQVVELAKHRAILTDPSYSDDPHTNISRDGRFAVFTSSWGQRGRWDVFILELPALPD